MFKSNGTINTFYDVFYNYEYAKINQRFQTMLHELTNKHWNGLVGEL